MTRFRADFSPIDSSPVSESGPWTYGGITTTGPNQHASVISPLGTVTLFDGTGGSAIGAINWVDVDTYQSAGALNGSAAVNLTGLTYTPGTTPISDLQQLVAGGLGSALLTFQFNPGMTLDGALDNLFERTGLWNANQRGMAIPRGRRNCRNFVPKFFVMRGSGCCSCS